MKTSLYQQDELDCTTVSYDLPDLSHYICKGLFLALSSDLVARNCTVHGSKVETYYDRGLLRLKYLQSL